MTTIHLDAKMIPSTLRSSYNGKKFKAVVATEMTIPADSGLWSGGSRDTYTVVRLEDGKAIEPVNHNASPWNAERQDILVKVEPGIVVIEHSMFCGKDMGLTIFVHPDSVAKLLPPPQLIMLTAYEKLVLVATKSLKSSYAGKDRWQNAQHEHYCMKALGGNPYPSREAWELAKHNLIERKLLNRAGAITVQGRNSIRT